MEILFVLKHLQVHLAPRLFDQITILFSSENRREEALWMKRWFGGGSGVGVGVEAFFFLKEVFDGGGMEWGERP